MTKTVWLSYDLGLRGDYEGLFRFLAEMEARECGGSLGVFNFPVKDDLMKELKAAVKKHVDLGKRDRIYVAYKGPNGKPTGQFLFGGRKAPPWAGYASTGADVEDVGD